MPIGKATFAIVASMVALIIVAATMLQSLLVLQRVAAVSDITGDVKVRTANSQAYYPLDGARYVKAGDVIRTGDGRVTLNWVDGTRIRVGEHSKLKVLKCQVNTATGNTVSLFQLDVGRVWIRVLRKLSPRSKFEVVTPTATAGVRGTVFSVSVDSLGRTEVQVLEGRVRVRAGQREVVVEGNKAARVLPASRASASVASPEAVVQLTPIKQRQPDEEFFSVLGPYLLLLQPAADTATVSDGQLLVRGKAELGAKVTVNGRPVTLGPGGRFTTAVPARAGEVVKLTVEATDAKGHRTAITRHIRITG